MNRLNEFTGDDAPPVDLRTTIMRTIIVISHEHGGCTHPRFYEVIYIGDLSLLARLLFHYSVPWRPQVSLWPGSGADRMEVWVKGPEDLNGRTWRYILGSLLKRKS